jgi:translation elongation factor EF-G
VDPALAFTVESATLTVNSTSDNLTSASGNFNLVNVGLGADVIVSAKAGTCSATEVQEGLQEGALTGYPVVDVHVYILDGSAHDKDSNKIAFGLAAASVPSF